MTIRDRFRRALHKSDSSRSPSQSDNSSTYTSATSSPATTVRGSAEHPPLGKTSSTKLFQWRSYDPEAARKKEAKEEKKNKGKKSKPVHPRDRPLTETNLRHQEMLSGFSMTFGSSPSRLSQLVPAGPFDDMDYGVSPCCTRNPSFDGGMVDPVASHDGSSTSLESSASCSSEAVPPPKVNASANTDY